MTSLTVWRALAGAFAILLAVITVVLFRRMGSGKMPFRLGMALAILCGSLSLEGIGVALLLYDIDITLATTSLGIVGNVIGLSYLAVGWRAVCAGTHRPMWMVSRRAIRTPRAPRFQGCSLCPRTNLIRAASV